MRILCIGDSITYGTGSTEGNSYPEILERNLNLRFKDITVVNRGCPGASTKDYWGYYISSEITHTNGLVHGENLYDGIHPFDEGYELIAGTIEKIISAHLTKNSAIF